MLVQGFSEETSPKGTLESKATMAQVKHVGAEGKAHAAQIETLQAQLRAEKEQRAQQDARLDQLSKQVKEMQHSPLASSAAGAQEIRMCSLRCGLAAAIRCPTCKAVFCKSCDNDEHEDEDKAGHVRKPIH